MKFIFSAAACALLILAAVNQASGVPATLDNDPHWTVFNSFGMSVDYPAGIFARDEGPATKGPGRKLLSKDGSAGLTFWVEPNLEHYNPEIFVRSRLKVDRADVDYQRVTDRFAVVSTVRAGRIYYSRCNFPNGASGPLHCVEMAYNRSEKRLWDSVVTRVSLSLR